MSLRTVTGILRNLREEPVTDSRVSIRLEPGSYTPEASYLASTLILRTDETGLLEVQLWANEDGDRASHYRVTLPDGEEFSFTLAPGTTPLTWSQVRVLGVTESDPQYQTLTTFVVEEIDERLAQGGVLPTDENGLIILDAGLLG